MEPLTIRDAVALGVIVSAAQRGAKVARLTDQADVIIGVARSIGDMNGGYASEHEDIRDCCLRVTTRAGFECFWPVRELIQEYVPGIFVPDYEE